MARKIRNKQGSRCTSAHRDEMKAAWIFGWPADCKLAPCILHEERKGYPFVAAYALAHTHTHTWRGRRESDVDRVRHIRFLRIPPSPCVSFEMRSLGESPDTALSFSFSLPPSSFLTFVIRNTIRN